MASIFSSFLGGQAYAENAPLPDISTPKSHINSQTIELLQANVSVANFKTKNVTESTNSEESSNISENALISSVGPLGDKADNAYEDLSSDQISVYVVRKGDVLSKIADMFGVSVNTILWANDIKRGDPLKEGEVLLILPISGVKHIVEKGQTLKGIATKYGADIGDIASFNGIPESASLAVGSELIIPEGEITIDAPINVAKTSTSKTSKTPAKDFSGYFVNPAPGAIKTQGLHGTNAVDLAGPIGTRILASAAGKVLVARTGWNGGYGGLIIIQHANGTKTVYGHLSQLNTSAGSDVSQGELIGLMGNTGRVRPSKGGNGSHLHFEVTGGKNPGANASWKR